MPGILADHNITGQGERLLQLFQAESRREYWTYLNFRTPSFADLGLHERSADFAVWLKCQQEQIVLMTDNRNAEGEDSLEETIRTLNTPQCLPVITLSDSQRFMRDRDYADRVADRILDYLFDLENLRGTGRLYVP